MWLGLRGGGGEKATFIITSFLLLGFCFIQAASSIICGIYQSISFFKKTQNLKSDLKSVEMVGKLMESKELKEISIIL